VIFLRCCPGHAHAEVCGLRVIWNTTDTDFGKILATRHSRFTCCLYFTLLQRCSL
jgi:hypothetical protein